MEEMEPKEQAEAIAEAHHRARFNRMVAVVVAFVAVFTAMCRLRDEKLVESILAAQARELDQWNYYQAQSIKQHGFQLAAQQSKVLSEVMGREAAPLVTGQLRAWQREIRRYDGKKAEAMNGAQAAHATYEFLEGRNDQLHLAEALLSLSIALFAVSALVQNRWLFALAVAFSAAGIAIGAVGFAGAAHG